MINNINGIQIVIGDTNISSSVEIESLRITDVASSRGDSAVLTYRTSRSEFIPQPGNPIYIWNLGEPYLQDDFYIFAGIITSTSVSHISGRYLKVNVEASDWTIYLDRRLVSKQFTSTNPKVVLQELLDQYARTANGSPLISLHPSEVEGNDLEIIPPSFDWVSVSDCIDKLAQTTNRFWWVDSSRRLHFVSRLTKSAPINMYLESGTGSGSVAYLTDPDPIDFEWEFSIMDMRTVVIFRDFAVQIPADQTLTLSLQANNPVVNLPYEPLSLSDITVELETNVGTNVFRRMVNRIDIYEGSPSNTYPEEGGVDDAFIGFDPPRVRFPRASETTLKDGHPISNRKVRVTMKALAVSDLADIHRFPQGISLLQSRERSFLGDPSTGEHDHILSVRDVIVTDLQRMLQEDANRFFVLYGSPTFKGRFRSFRRGWRAGQWFTIYMPNYGILDYIARERGDSDQSLRVYTTRVEYSLVSPRSLMATVEFSNRPVDL